jgi:hypothetical protein
VLKRTVTHENVGQDTRGAFYIPMLLPGPYPGKILMREPGSTGVLLAHMPFNDGNRIAAFLECATSIRDAVAAARLGQCRKWLDVGVLSGSVLATCSQS